LSVIPRRESASSFALAFSIALLSVIPRRESVSPPSATARPLTLS
jgi:hypothetical protein